MVSQIIPALPKSSQTELINETIYSLEQSNHDIPSTMSPDNFQTEIGGHIQGLIGAKHLEPAVAVLFGEWRYDSGH